MAISNYTELLSFVPSWAHRSDLTTIMPDIVKLGESYLNRRIRTRSQDNITDLTASTSTRLLAFPSRMAELCDLSIVIGVDQQRLQQVGREQFYQYVNEAQAMPSCYTVRDQIEFDVIPDQAYTIKCHYYKTLDIASDSTNYVLTNYPDAYLFACMAAIKLFTKDDPATYLGMMNEVIDTINDQESRNKSSTLVTELTSISGFNIVSGR